MLLAVLKILATALMIAGIVIVIKKKISMPIAFTMLGFAGMLVGSFLNGGTLPLAEGAGSTGYIFFDLFEFFKAQGILNNLATVGMNMFAITGYVFYMNYLKASDLFALIIVKPLKKIKNKYIVAGFSYLLTIMLFLVIPNSIGRIALLFGITFPVMIACGVSRPTAAVSILAPVGIVWGPANTGVLNAYALGGFDASSLDLVEHFATVETPWNFLAIGCGLAVYVITSMIFDKKLQEKGIIEEVKELPDPKSLGIPMWWAAFPILPIIMIMLFSSIVPWTPNLSIPCIEYMCFTIVYILVILSSKNKIAAINGGNQLFVSFGQNVANIISMVFGGTVFGKGIQMIGGFDLALQPIMAAENPSVLLFIVVATIVGVIIGLAAGNNFVSYSIVGNTINTFATGLGLPVGPFAMMMTGCFQPVMGMAPATAFMAHTVNSSGVEVGTIIKRTIPIEITMILVFMIGAIVQLCF